MRGLGVREITSGVGILSNERTAEWLWSRVAGDVMDLALLSRALEDEEAIVREAAFKVWELRFRDLIGRL